MSRARAHFYVCCNKIGTQWSYTDYHPFLDYEVNLVWLTSWWSVGKFTHDQYQQILLRCRKAYRSFVQNAEAVVVAERKVSLLAYQKEVQRLLAQTRLKFRPIDDAIFPLLP